VARTPQRVVLDAAPLIALLREEPNAARIADVVGDAHTSVSTVTLAETTDVLERVHGWSARTIADTVRGVLDVAVEFVPPTPEIALRAGSLRLATTADAPTTSRSATASCWPRLPAVRPS
jgi:uncharacterized protein with PIN domain